MATTEIRGQTIANQPAVLTGKIDFPFTYLPLRFPGPIVQISINGASPLLFQLDTGYSGGVMLDAWAAKQLGLKATGDAPSIQNSHITLQTVSIQSVVLCNKHNGLDLGINSGFIGDLTLLHEVSPRVAGVIGLPALLAYQVHLDFSTSTLTLSSPSMKARFAADAIRVPFTLTDGRAYATSVSTVDGLLSLTGKAETPCLIDTGSMGTMLPAEEAGKINMVAVELRPEVVAAGEYMRTKLLTALKWGHETRPLEVGLVVPPDTVRLGLDVLSHFRVTLDFTDKVLTLEPNEKSVEWTVGETGILLDVDSGKAVISDVQPGSVAEKANVRAGDELVEVDGLSLSRLPFSSVQNAISGWSGTTAHLVVRRHGKTITYRLKRRSDAEADAYLRPGLRIGTFIVNGKTSRLVSGVLCSSAAWQAGIRPFDDLLAVNGVSVQGKTFAQIETLLQNLCTGQTLTVLHPMETKQQTVMLALAPVKP